MEDQGQKRASAGDGGPPEKRLKGEPEDTEVYSQRIKKKLQANSRTGQACDRCKVSIQIITFTSASSHFPVTDIVLLEFQERKMKCDSGQDGCQPCQSKNFRCVATDRITGHTYERGETVRLTKEVEELRAQVDAYRQHFELQNPAQYPMQGAYQAYAGPNGYSRYAACSSSSPLSSWLHTCTNLWSASNPPRNQQSSIPEPHANTNSRSSSDTDGPHIGPIHETTIDFVDGEIDIGAFVCPDMEETRRISQETLPLNNSRCSSLSTILGARKPERPQMPSRDDALQYIDNYQKVIAPYVPIVHGPTFRKQVSLYYQSLHLPR